MAKRKQPVPIVDALDVERIVRRDFSPDVAETVLSVVATIEVREKSRVVLGCLKIAGGNFDRLRAELTSASGYYREILSEAEYPRATKLWSKMSTMSDDECQAIYDSDRRQYSEWLTRA